MGGGIALKGVFAFAGTTGMAADRIVAFYSGGTDDRGRTLDEILSWPDSRLEAVHDFVQWLFPTPFRSGANPSAPRVSPATVRAFESPELRARLRRALDRMLAFYGLERSVPAGAPVIAIDPERFRERAGTWLHPSNHNHLRLTRILQSLSALGLPAEARALQRCLLVEVCEGPGRGRVSAESRRYWQEALDA